MQCIDRWREEIEAVDLTINNLEQRKVGTTVLTAEILADDIETMRRVRVIMSIRKREWEEQMIPVIRVPLPARNIG